MKDARPFGALGMPLARIPAAVLALCRELYAARYAALRAEWQALQVTANQPKEP